MPKKVEGDASDRVEFQNETLAQLCGLALFAISWAPTIAILVLARSTEGFSEEAKIWNGRLWTLAIGAIIALPGPCMYGALICFSVRVVTAICIGIPYTGIMWIMTVFLLLSIYGFNV